MINPFMHKLIATLSLLFFSGASSLHPTESPSLLIAGGTVVDGTGAKPRRADVRIENDRIVAVGALKPKTGERVIDAKGLVVAPGFIDTHSHADAGLLEKPDAEPVIRQGITTAVVGQDGSSHYPLADYFSQLNKTHVAINIASFVGHGTVRQQAMKEDFKRPAHPEELAQMGVLIDSEMREGGLGLSSGLEYDPGYYSTTEELIACAKHAAAQGGLYISHVRNEDNHAIEAFKELITIAEQAKLPAQISHIKLGSKSVWGKAGEVLKLMSDARKRGLDISADVYAYLYWQSSIIVLIPTRNWEDRAAWQKGLDDVGGPGHVLLANYTPDAKWAGKTIAEIATMTGKDAITVIQEVVRRTHGPNADGFEGVVVTAMTEEDLRTFLKDPNIMICSDGVPGGTHPRGAGNYPRILGRYVREEKVLKLEEAVHKMTSLPASRMGFKDRGSIKTGMKADIVIFDPRTVIDTATTVNPKSAPIGINFVLVNGQLVIEGGKVTGARPGEVVRRTHQ